MFSILSTSNAIFPPRNNIKDRPFYSISKEQLDKMVTCIIKEEKELISQGLIPNFQEEDEGVEEIVLNSIQDLDQVETTHGLQQDQIAEKQLLPPILYKETTNDEPECVEIPLVNIEAPETHPNDQDKQKVVDESMATYKINRQKYHQFCQIQAQKQEQARKQRKKHKILARKGEEGAQKRSGKAKTWKAEATSTKKILSASNASQKAQKQSKEAMTVIDKLTIPSMYHLSPMQANCIGYSCTPNEDPFFQGVYESVKADMQYARIYKLRQSNLSKIRTFIVRRILDDFVAQRHQDSPQQKQHLARHNRRITRLDRNRYVQAGISEPPSRMKSHYLQQIFTNQPFSHYYINYLSSERLKNYMEMSNQEMTEKFWQQVLAISRKENLSVNEKIVLFKDIKKKPLFRSQITEYLQEANMIKIEYCKLPAPLIK